jgi:hypothetical protein
MKKSLLWFGATMDLCKNNVVSAVIQRLMIVVFIVGIYAVSAYRAEAVPVLNTSNGNYYEYVQVYDSPTNVGDGVLNSWATASANASASVFNINGIDTNGHLATITSQAENDFILSLAPTGFEGLTGGWIGGKDPVGWLEGPEDGDTFTYTNWGAVEPNNAGYAYMNFGDFGEAGNKGIWYDDSDVQGQGVPSFPNDPVIGYFVEYEPVISIDIDIKPGSDPNCFNINGHGVIPVAILGSAEFDVTQINPLTLLFAGLEMRMRGNKGPLYHYEDVNGDGHLDMVCQFEDDPTFWTPGDGEADITGQLDDGTEFKGTDSICIVP